MTIGSGLGATFGAGEESSYGAVATVDHFYEITSEGLELTKNIVQGGGLRGSRRFDRAARRKEPTRTAGGPVSMELPTRKLGLWLEHMLGSTPVVTQLGGTSAYRQIHTPGELTGKSLTLQKAVPQVNGTQKPFTYPGCKIGGWTIACARGAIATLELTVDARDELTDEALVPATFPTAGDGVFSFEEGALILGGTVSTVGGVTSLAGGTTVAEVRGITLSGGNPMDTERFHLGAAGRKAEPIENGKSTVTGALDAEFVNQATIYDLFAADEGTALLLRFTAEDEIAVGYANQLELIVPAIFFEGESPKVGGPEVVGINAGFTALDDDVNPLLQAALISLDTAP